MQVNMFDINESGRILIDDRVYYRIEKDPCGLIENQNTKEKALLTVCTEPEAADRIEAFEYDVMAGISNVRCRKSLIYPGVITWKKDEGCSETYLYTEIPKEYSEGKLIRLHQSYMAEGFSIGARILAAMNLSMIWGELQTVIDKNLLSMHPESIYVNIENGDVYIWMESWLQPESVQNPIEPGYPPEWYIREEKKLTKTDIQYFLTYSTFRLLCGDEPFDGSETLLQFPLLTMEALRDIHAGNYEFALVKGKNPVSEYIGQGLLKKWRAFPAFIRNVYERNFTLGIRQPEERTPINEWLKLLRKLRDCLVYVNGQIRFCDPEVSNQVMFMVVDDYKIPVWPKKAVYWYHVDIEWSESKNGIVAGVTMKDGKYYLNNLSGNVWGAVMNNTNLWIYPDKDVEIVEGLKIQLENEKTIQIVNGQI